MEEFWALCKAHLAGGETSRLGEVPSMRLSLPTGAETEGHEQGREVSSMEMFHGLDGKRAASSMAGKIGAGKRAYCALVESMSVNLSDAR